MTLGMSLVTFTLVHVVLSLVGIAFGFAVVFGLFTSKLLPRSTFVFLVSTLATTITGFLFPFHRFLPSHAIGILTLIVLADAIIARYRFHMVGTWRLHYVVCSVVALYFNVFIAIVQLFEKVPSLRTLAPTQSAPPFIIAQLVALGVFIAFGFYGSKRFVVVSSRR